jgi:pilus assembly protein CpaB
MNNTVLRIISALLALGALGVGYFAIQLSKAPSAPIAAPAPTPEVPKESVAVGARQIKAGQVLAATDLALKGVQSPPPGAYRNLQEVIGRVAVADIPADTPLLASHFAADSIAYLLKPDERAVGIQIDEVAAVGGFAKPGETVDVLAFLSKDGEISSSAQVVVENARLLTMGDATQLDNEAARANQSNLGDALAKESGAKSASEIKERRMHLKSAVLAVRKNDVNRLMLASNAGVLRLALRPPVGNDPNRTLTGASNAPQMTKAAPAVLSDISMRRPSTDGGSARKLVIQEGSKEREVTTDKKK